MKKALLLLTVILGTTGFSVLGQAITGRVTSAKDGTALPGVSVLVKGTTIGTTTDSEGQFSIQPQGTADPVLTFSFIGFATLDVAVAGRTSLGDVGLEEDITQLGEVVVTALGISREKRALGYATGAVDSKEIVQAGNTNFASALYGRSPGVRVSTAPGGATSAVNVQIRGINSIKAVGNQPLYVVDGVIIRNQEEKINGVNNGGYWDDTKIRGNGILDINPADIESLNILRGASAAALYGSEASNGVIVITTKRGTKSKGLGVEVNYNYTVENVAFTPKYQNTYGPGYDRETNIVSFGVNDEGFIPTDVDGDGVNETIRPNFRSWAQFGPKMDGREVAWWDGSTRKYVARPDNYKDFYQTGMNSSLNFALSNSSDRGSFRLSYTRLDYEGIARGSYLDRNTFNLNGSLKLSDKLTADVVVNYMNSFVHNRPEAISRLTANYGGFFSRTDDMGVYLDKYKTSTGHKYVTLADKNRNPAEAIKYNIRATDLLEYLWRNVRDNDNEYQDRIISSVTLNYQILKDLKIRGRVGNDFTSLRNEIERHNDYPTSFNGSNSTGQYTLSQGRYANLYTDALLTYNKDINEDFSFSVMGGFQSRQQNYVDQRSSTEGGLVEENWFSLSNSFGVKSTTSSRIQSTMYAYLGMVNFSYKDFLYLEGTARQEYTSTLPPDNNGYFYPSVNAGFVFTDAFQLPAFFTYGKLRASHARIANGTTPYAANIVYTQTPLATTNGSVAHLTSGRSYGNNDLKPERKIETEFGLETSFLDNKIGIDFTYYVNTVKDQIIDLSLAPSMGAGSVVANLGQLTSRGVELGLNFRPIDNGDFRWDARFNFSKNVTKVDELAPGLNEFTFHDADAGAVLLKAEVGQALGTIYTHYRLKDEDGNYIITEDGLYKMSSGADYKRVGNIQPKAAGGLSNTLTYKGLSLNFLIDYRFGGKLISPPHLYAYGAGMYKSTMKYRDEEHGGLPYNIDNDGNKILAPSHDGAEFHDGVLLKGVNEEGDENTTIVDAAYYYINSFYWASGRYESQGVLKNDYVKMREITLGYNLPKNIAEKLKFQSLRVSVIGRNLFYLYRTLDNLDPEVAVGSNWRRQGIDEGSMAATRSLGFAINGSF